MSEKVHISFDVEASGPVPGLYSMMAFGACDVADPHNEERQFYRELQPIPEAGVITSATAIGARGLSCLESKPDSCYDPDSGDFDAGAVMDVLSLEGADLQQAMTDFAEWVKEVAGGRPVKACAAPAAFDFPFMRHYLLRYAGVDALGYSALCISSLYKGVSGDLSASIRDLDLRQETGLTHNALEDAVQQALEMQAVLEMMKSP